MWHLRLNYASLQGAARRDMFICVAPFKHKGCAKCSCSRILELIYSSALWFDLWLSKHFHNTRWICNALSGSAIHYIAEVIVCTFALGKRATGVAKERFPLTITLLDHKIQICISLVKCQSILKLCPYLLRYQQTALETCWRKQVDHKYFLRIAQMWHPLCSYKTSAWRYQRTLMLTHSAFHTTSSQIYPILWNTVIHKPQYLSIFWVFTL